MTRQTASETHRDPSKTAKSSYRLAAWRSRSSSTSRWINYDRSHRCRVNVEWTFNWVILSPLASSWFASEIRWENWLGARGFISEGEASLEEIRARSVINFLTFNAPGQFIDVAWVGWGTIVGASPAVTGVMLLINVGV